MHTLHTQLLIIGAGPGGYVCAIRAGQLGVKTIIVEADKPGGTCLNVGCIPSKALIHAADEFHKLVNYCDTSHASETMGIRSQSATIDLSATMAWKDGIVSRLNGGVSGLLKNANVQVIHGTARFRDGKTVVVESSDGSIKGSIRGSIKAQSEAQSEAQSKAQMMEPWMVQLMDLYRFTVRTW